MANACVMCPKDNPNVAAVYCEADACYLCISCDIEVHSANRLAQRHIRRPVTIAEASAAFSAPNDSDSDLVPDIVSSAKVNPTRIGTVKSSSASRDSSSDFPMAPLSFEDAAEYDFYDFANLSAKMPSLDIEDESVLQTCKVFGNSASSEPSWESMIPDSVEHVVPDVGPVTMSPVTCFSTKNDYGTEAETMRDKSVTQPPLLSKLSKTSLASVSSSAISTITTSQDEAASIRKSFSTNDLQIENGENENEVARASQSAQITCTVQKSAEQRRKMRLEALERFRNKRANRSFTKKVRYECRKQLADSRPRVKGRFVKKSEMALYRKYGAMYRNHMDELRTETSPGEDQCVPTI